MHLYSAPSGRRSSQTSCITTLKSHELERCHKWDTCEEMPIFGLILSDTKIGRHLAISFPVFIHFMLRHEFCFKKIYFLGFYHI